MLNMYLLLIDTVEERIKFEEIYKKYYELVLKITYNTLKDQFYAEDASQTAWFNIAKNIDKIKCDDEKMLKAYVARVARNAALDEYKINKKHMTVTLHDNVVTDRIVAGDENEDLTEVKKALLDLPKLYRDVLAFHLIDELKPFEIARLVNKPQVTVRSIIFRGKRILADKLREAGIDV